MFSPLALVKQTPGSHEASTHNSCPLQNRTASNLQSTRRSGTGLRDSSDANWLLVKDHPGGKQRALEILMPLTTLEECPLQKPLLCDSYFLFFFCCCFFSLFLSKLSHSLAQRCRRRPVSHNAFVMGCLQHWQTNICLVRAQTAPFSESAICYLTVKRVTDNGYTRGCLFRRKPVSSLSLSKKLTWQTQFWTYIFCVGMSKVYWYFGTKWIIK